MAVVDIGTNSVHMLIVRIDADLRTHVIDKAKEMVRLGTGTFESGRLDEATQRRALEALVRFRRLAERRGVEHYLSVATSAVREADNGGAFLQEVYAATGIRPQMISGAEEARLTFKAVQSMVPLDEKPFLVVDLGGGSIEFACGSSRALAWTASLKLGVQRLEALALKDGEVVKGGQEALAEVFARDVDPVVARAREAGVTTCFVTSGSAMAALKMLRARAEVDAKDVHLPRKALRELDDDLAKMSRDKRVALEGVEAQRVDLVVPAVAFFAHIADALGAPTLEVSERGLREGLLQDYVDRHGAEIQWELMEPNSRRRAVLRFAERLHYDAPHAHHVAHLAVELFDATKAFHDLDERSRELLEYGALVHDVGYAVAEKAHHKHSEYLVLHGLAGGFSERETRVIAALARYHRKGMPKSDHENWSRLGEADRQFVLKAGALLRIADGLDRSHGRAVEKVALAQDAGGLAVEIRSTEACDLEMWAARRKTDWFEHVYGKSLVFRVAAEKPPRRAKKEVGA